ncbi:ROK family protein [candidate division KSB1 bacterium]|nr:ROK family protein [candidate division KSB1 bacterium]RQW05601.1 MAG: ROK family protein [candidate division KSB1 bacterium]
MATEFFAGLDLGGSFLKYAIGTADGVILKRDKKPSRADEAGDKVFQVIFDAIRELEKEAKRRNGDLKGIGLGSPGAIDFERGRLIGTTPNIANWANADIRGTVEKEVSIPVWVDNDANIMALAESRQGAARGFQNVICATLGTGIGGGILIGGEIYRGSHYAGSEIGHMMIVHDGLPCNCGGRGCFEKYASAPAMVRHYISKMMESGKPVPDNISTFTVFQNAEKGEPEANEAIDKTLGYLGTGFASLINIFNPEILVVGGGVADAGEDFIARIQHAIEERAMKPALRGLKVAKAQLGNDAGFVGGINLAAEMFHKAN